jgi:hypothetical protein
VRCCAHSPTVELTRMIRGAKCRGASVTTTACQGRARACTLRRKNLARCTDHQGSRSPHRSPTSLQTATRLAGLPCTPTARHVRQNLCLCTESSRVRVSRTQRCTTSAAHLSDPHMRACSSWFVITRSETAQHAVGGESERASQSHARFRNDSIDSTLRVHSLRVEKSIRRAIRDKSASVYSSHKHVKRGAAQPLGQ